MKKLFYILIPLLLASLFFAIYVFFFSSNKGKGALQVTATPKSNVYLNGKLIGQTPLCKCETNDMLQTGEYTVRVVPQEAGFGEFEERITINKSVLTVVDRSFGESGSSQGSVITLTPLSDKNSVELLVLSLPDKTDVSVDNSKSGSTPLLLKNITDSDHEIRLAKDGYIEKQVRIRTVKGYKLAATIYLGAALVFPTPTAVASPSASPTPVASVTILSTPLGFLRVRSEPSINSKEISQVKPGEEYPLVSEQMNWFEIQLSETITGWISSQYATKN